MNPRSSGRGGLLVAGIMFSVLTEALAGTVLSLGRIDMIGDLHATPDEFAALDISYTAAKLFGFLVAGWLAGHVPVRHLVVLATLAMGGACGLAVLTTRPDLLVALRVLQGMAGGLLLVGGQVLDRLTQGAPHRIVLFDSPPALAASPAAALAKYVGQVMLVVRADQTGQGALEDAISLLSACPNIQLLLNAANFSPSGRTFGAYHGYGE